MVSHAVYYKLIEQYFITSPSLNRVFLLIDGRRGIKDIDLNFMKNLEKFAIVFEVIVTKIDKLDYKNARNLVSEIERINSTFTTAFPRVILTSCINNNGLDKLRAEIFKLLN